jgi:hypothetical protein
MFPVGVISLRVVGRRLPCSPFKFRQTWELHVLLGGGYKSLLGVSCTGCVGHACCVCVGMVGVTPTDLPTLCCGMVH